MILHTRPSNERFIIQLEEYKIELSKCAANDWHKPSFQALASTLLLIGQDLSNYILGKSIFSQVFVGMFKHLLEKQRWNDK